MPRVAFIAAMAVFGLCHNAAAQSTGPNPIYDAASYQKLTGSCANGKKYLVDAPNGARLPVVHTYGNTTERGVAYGTLLADEIVAFGITGMDSFFDQEADSLLKYITWMPASWQKAIKAFLNKDAPGAFDLALKLIAGVQAGYIAKSPAQPWAEAAAIAAGVCAATPPPQDLPADYCANGGKKLAARLRAVNMLPELVQMQCSMMGAWGAATKGAAGAASGALVQLRSLDFGSGPFANANMLAVAHPPAPAHAFASISFPGFVGAVTGFSETLGLSEKVDDVTGGKRPKGTYSGQAVALVIRDILQFANGTDDAIAIARAAKRTWSVWLGFGDTTNKFRAVSYTEANVTAFDDTSLPGETSQPAFAGVAYIDKHPQPSAHTTFPALIKQFYGNMTGANVAANFPVGMQTGDVHAAVYDFGAGRTYVASGTTTPNGTTWTRKACNAPFLAFENAALWKEAKP